VTAIGRIDLTRKYFTCGVCNQGEFAADPILGIDGFVTQAACRIICCLSVQQSFERTEWTMREALGWAVDEETVRRVTHRTSAQASATRDERATAEHFATSAGDGELQIDAGKVNTQEGWRDVKTAVFARRERGEPASADQWHTRILPKPTVRSVIAAVEEAEAFGHRCAEEASRLNLIDLAPLSVLGDGAEWIWNLTHRHFAGAHEVLDIYHGSLYLSAIAKAKFADAEPIKIATDEGRRRLLEDGYWGVTEWIGAMSEQMPAGGDGAALGEGLNYFAGQQDRLHYALRLRRGQSIGSGMVEGTVKQLLNKRLKQTGARWRVEHVGPLVEFGALAQGPEWNAFWSKN
jgi:hypothetical protein